MPDEIYFKTNQMEAVRGLAKWAQEHLKDGFIGMVIIDRKHEGRTFTFTFHDESYKGDMTTEERIAICVDAMEAIASQNPDALHTKTRIE